MKAVVTLPDQKLALRNVEVPIPGPGEILVRIIAAGGNISDNYTLQNVKSVGRIPGFDYAGYVEELGPNVPEGLLKKGQRVAGFKLAASLELAGTFAEHCLADPALAVVIPDHISFEEAATIGLCGFTAAQALFQVRRTPTPLAPLSKKEPILIWGAASILGMFAVQLANLSGYDVVATCSPINHDLVKSFGASYIIDYKETDAVQKIRDYTNDSLGFAVDCISSGPMKTPQLVTQCLGSKGGLISSVLPYDDEHLDLRKDVKVDFVLVFTLLGKAFDYPIVFPATESHHDDGAQYAKILSQLLQERRLQIPPLKIMPRGLGSVEDGLHDIVAGKVKAQKLIYRISDTPEVVSEVAI